MLEVKSFWHFAYIFICTVYPKKYAHGFLVLCFVVIMQSFKMKSHEVFIHVHQGCFACTGAIVRLPQCQWSKPDVYGKISQCITTTKHSKAKTVCIFLGIYCISWLKFVIYSNFTKVWSHVFRWKWIRQWYYLKELWYSAAFVPFVFCCAMHEMSINFDIGHHYVIF